MVKHPVIVFIHTKHTHTLTQSQIIHQLPPTPLHAQPTAHPPAHPSTHTNLDATTNTSALAATAQAVVLGDDDLLPRQPCLQALAALRHAKWFQVCFKLNFTLHTHQHTHSNTTLSYTHTHTNTTPIIHIAHPVVGRQMYSREVVPPRWAPNNFVLRQLCPLPLSYKSTLIKPYIFF